MKFSTLVLCSVGALMPSSSAWAHIQLLAPTPRVANTDSIKEGPCGPMARNNARTTTFRPGETITLEWQETVPHPGYYRVLLDESGQNDLPAPTMESFMLFKTYYNSANKPQVPAPVMGPKKEGNTWVLADYWGQHPAGGAKKWSLKVTLPDVTCSNCTLQLVQSMFESSRSYGNAYYYHCADLVLQGQSTANPDAGGMDTKDAGAPREDASAGGSGGAGSGGRGGQAGQNAGGGSAGGRPGEDQEGGQGGEGGEGEGGGGSGADSDSNSDKGGCVYGGGTAPAGAWLLAFVLLARRWRRLRTRS